MKIMDLLSTTACQIDKADPELADFGEEWAGDFSQRGQEYLVDALWMERLLVQAKGGLSEADEDKQIRYCRLLTHLCNKI